MNKPPRRRTCFFSRWCFVGAVAALWMAVATRSQAASTGTMTKSSAYGLTLVVSTQWLDGSGYRPVQVSVLPAAPPKADQTLHVEFKAQERSYPPRQILVSQDIEIPAGSTQVTDTLAVPQEFAFQWCEVEVWLDGVHKPKLTQNAPVGVSGLHSEGLPNILIVSGALTLGPPAGPFTIAMVADPDSSVLAGIFPDELVQQQGYGYGRPVATTTPAGTTLVAPSLPTLITVPYNHLPRRWIEFSSLDIVCLSLADLTALRGAEPERWQALRRWAAAGGNLLVFGVGAKLDRIDEISDALQLPRGDDTAGEWTKPNPADFGNRLNSPYSGFGTVVVDAPVAGSPPLASEPPFLLHPFGTGMVVAVAADDLFKEPQQNWAWMLNSLGPDRWLWYRRHGLSRERKNADFWNWLVRGVGLAPVTEFRVLITVFVLAIGPVNYFWLRRRGRLHLLVVIVPLAAMAVTLGLFGYAVLADGLDIRVRARTFTQIDQRSGQAVCWSRLSYYAGLAPAGGLTFPDDVVVSPLTANDSGESDMARRQSLAWSQHEQHLVSGWLASRTPMQFVTVRSRTSQAGLRLLPPRGQAGPQVENQLGTRVVRLLLSDEQGRHFRAVDLAAGARGQLEAASPADEEAAIYEFVKDRQPSVPEGFVAPSAQVFAGRRRFMYAATNNSLLGASLASGLLEANLREAVLGPGKHVSLSKPTGFPLAPRSYLAVVERSPEVVFGVDQVREEDSLHIVVGKW